MLPNYRAWDVEKRLKESTVDSNIKKLLKEFIETMHEREERYDRYNKELKDIRDKKDKMTEKEYNLETLRRDVGKGDIKRLMDKTNRDICFYARAAHILKDRDAGDIIEEGKPTFRSGDEQAKQIIRNMNRITSKLNKKFR